MEKLFGETLVYAKSKEGDLGMPSSDLQKETMRTFLQPLGDQNKYRLRADLKQLPITEGDKHYFATPSINSGVAEYLSVLSQKSDKPRDKHPLPPGPTRNLDKELERMDGCARAGLKFAIYVQWLISSIKHQLLNALEEDDSLRDPEGDLMQTLDEGFNASMMPIKQMCRVASMATMERRRIYLEELKLKPFPMAMATNLPVDLDKGLLFGKETSSDGKVNDIETIIAQYSEKSQEVQKYGNAFKVPLNPQSSGQDRFKGKRKESDDKRQPDRKRQKSSRHGQKRSSNTNSGSGGFKKKGNDSFRKSSNDRQGEGRN